MSVERVLPKTLDYTDVLPLAVESKSRRRTFFPNNGNLFNTGGNNIIRIDLSADALLDTQHSYLRFTAAAAAGAKGIDPAGGHAFISRLRVEQSGTILEDIQSYNKLMGAIILPCQASSEYDGVRELTEGQHAPFSAVNAVSPASVAQGAAAGVPLNVGIEATGLGCNGAAQVPAGTAVDFCIPLTSGLLNCDKLVPLMLMSAPLTIEIELAPTAECVVGAAGDMNITNVRYIANLVEVGAEVGQQLRMLQEMSGGVLTLAGQTYRHFAGSIPAGGTQTNINVPARVKSMKSIFFNMPGFNNVGAGNLAPSLGSFDVGTGGHNNVESFQFKIGSVVYPPTPIRCRFGTALAVAAGNEVTVAGETLMELEKAWGNVGSRFGLGGKTKGAGFYASAATLATPLAAGAGFNLAVSTQRYAPFGLDMEAFQRVAIESGVNTADRALPITLTLDHTASIASNIDVYVLADALFYINSDGSMSVSV